MENLKSKELEERREKERQILKDLDIIKDLKEILDSEQILENLKELKGQNINEAYNNIIDCFNTEKEVIVNKSNNNGYDYVVYVNKEDSKQYLININENNEISEIWRV